MPTPHRWNKIKAKAWHRYRKALAGTDQPIDPKVQPLIAQAWKVDLIPVASCQGHHPREKVEKLEIPKRFKDLPREERLIATKKWRLRRTQGHLTALLNWDEADVDALIQKLPTFVKCEDWRTSTPKSAYIPEEVPWMRFSWQYRDQDEAIQILLKLLTPEV